MSDEAEAFGYKNSWLAVRCDTSARVAEALGAGDFVPATWTQGIGGAYAGKAIFVSPPVDGWVLVAGYWVMDRSVEEQERHLIELSRMFGEAQLFANHRVVDHYAWMRARDGSLLRAFVHADDGRLVRDFGEREPLEPEAGETPDEEQMMLLAGMWSVDPTQLDSHESGGGVGLAAPNPAILSEVLHEAVRGQADPVTSGTANSAVEADLHFDSMKCPECGHWMQDEHQRHGLPWEDFAYEIAATCSSPSCEQRVRVRYLAGPGWATQPGPGEIAITDRAEPSTLIPPRGFEDLVEAELSNIEMMEQHHRDQGLGEDEIREENRAHAASALGALLELEKFSPAPPSTRAPRHQELKEKLQKMLSVD